MTEQEKWRWATQHQGFEGDFAEWAALPADERQEYEDGAAGIPTA